MMSNSPSRARTPGFWTVLFLLLGTARRRAVGRQKRQKELMQTRSKQASAGLEGLATFLSCVFTLVLHGMAAYLVYSAAGAGVRIEAERGGLLVVDRWFIQQVNEVKEAALAKGDRESSNASLENAYHDEARRLAREDGKEKQEVEKELRASIQAYGTGHLLAEEDLPSGISILSGRGLPALLGSLGLLWWAVMMVFQGEGLELDIQRRRHPMWEWLFSHPVPAGAIFAAEMLSPVAANPIYWTAPLFVGILYSWAYDAGVGLLAAALIGIPVSVAAACLGKALEIGVSIRFSPRSRGALLGLMGWLGYVSFILMFLCVRSIATTAAVASRFTAPFASWLGPVLGWFLGLHGNHPPSFATGVATCWIVAAVTIALAVRFCVWGANRGLSGSAGMTDTAPAATARGARFGKEPLYRKELLWFIRDRSAVVQSILIPLTVAGFQVYNLRGAVQVAQTSWNYLSGAAILFGTYFLWVLGPKSLASEGPALWISLTWPRGLESLLKAKAWLWAMVSTGVVTLVLVYNVYLFPAQAWKVGLVGLGWLAFGRSMAEKTVTLVTVTSSSGDPEPIPRSRRWAASLGMLTFAIGVVTQQWHVAIMGIVYSYITAAAMWENFRARLPFLYDPWSEKLPPPPTLMHAMIAISILVEIGAVVTAPVVVFAGGEYVAVVSGMVYAVCAFGVVLGVKEFLSARGVSLRDVWYWPQVQVFPAKTATWWFAEHGLGRSFLATPLWGVTGGVLLGLAARGYLAALLHIPSLAEMIHRNHEQMAKIGGFKLYYAICAVGVAPFAEEYLFRGLLFRALDREWGGWKAIVGSAAFFAIYHPPLAWLPVGLLGAANAWLFKTTGRLTPAVILHMIYNAVVLM